MKNCVAAIAVLFSSVGAIERAGAADLPPFDKVSADFQAVSVSDQQDRKGFFNVWERKKDAQLLAELPKNFASKSYFVALTLSSGDKYAGLQSGELVVKWRQYDNRLALIAPNLSIRATGDAESKASVKRLFTDQVLLDIPVLAKGPTGGPVIDLDSLLINNAGTFYGRSVRISNPRITSIESVKVFPSNVEVAVEIVGASGRFQTLHYSFSEVPSPSSGFKPRVADQRVGYFTTTYTDLSKYTDDETRVRYINRWNLQKRDSKLKLSPPKEPIIFYVEHTAPVRYRRWIKAGIDYWNKAFEKVGIVDAIEVRYQDAESGAHMEKDPEDIRYNFVRWLNNDVGTAIGPSRVHPMTGEILDADIILTDGWIRHFNFNYDDLMPRLAMEGVSPETLAWLSEHPSWDPRVRMTSPSKVAQVREQIAREARQPYAGYAMAAADSTLIGDDEYDGLIGHISQKNGMCMAAGARSLDLAIARMDWALALLDDKPKVDDEKEKDKEDAEKEDDESSDEKSKEEEKDDAEKDDSDKGDSSDDKTADSKDDASDDKKDDEKDDSDMLDGMPDWFVGPLLADLVAHEVGHTIGLRHNFKGSALYTLDEINSEEVKGKKTFTASVMDYTPINFRYESGDVQGDYGMIDIGPYDYWAIEYGYSFDDKKLPELLKRCVEPELQYATDEDTSGPDPLARRYDFAKDPLDYAEEQMRLVKLYRTRILDKFVKEGDTWAKARRGYELTLSLQTRAASMMANWVGGAFVNRDKKGDPGDRSPVQVVPAEQQRAAIQFVIDNTFNDAAFGLTPKLLERMTSERWLDGSGHFGSSGEATWPVHDRVLGLQSSALTWLMSPTTLRRVYDNEMRLPADADAVTLPELLDTISEAAWTEIEAECPDGRNNRQPMITSLRRNLQKEHTQRLIDLLLEKNNNTAAYKPITDLARMELVDLQKEIEERLKTCEKKMDAYSRAHLNETAMRIGQALQAGFTYNSGAGASGGRILILGETPAE
ncbi:zinc-dependent metalloprotease [Roseiconus lacunae]|uniref:Zinc-dependent metalloprotease n=1 Tax=Roseiconus lacunae TaxID=2605694 RepID=A0ABT7PLD3_9BACT|nr:zinc-dependent metalloprotease [Roseiconus lacunae]MDM4017312.1 zinc-dependent metalloprotease [Roseiconus lacunae]